MLSKLFVLTGALDSGKSSCLNALLAARRPRPESLLLISFERGDIPLQAPPGVRHHSFSLRELRRDPTPLQRLREELQQHPYTEVWVEWNGSLPYAYFSRLFLEDFSARQAPKLRGWPCLSEFLDLQALLVLSGANDLAAELEREGSVLPEYLYNADYLVYRSGQEKNLAALLERLNSQARLLCADETEHCLAELLRPRRSALRPILVPLGLLILLRLGAYAWEPLSQSFGDWTLRVLGTFLQAFPYLLLGVCLSTALEVLLPDDWILRHFPRRLGPGLGFALLAAFCLPVCDCASVPVFRGLIRKGVPLPAALFFMLVSPVINPVVLLSTWAAYPDYPQMLLWRSGLGLLAALLTTLSFALWPVNSGFERSRSLAACRAGLFDLPDESKGRRWLRQWRGELFNVGAYLIVGIAVSALFQAFLARWNLRSLPFPLALPFLLLLAFLLSLCSSSDAILARSYQPFFGFFPVLGFLVFGPMMDLKNLAMLSGLGNRRFHLRLLLSLLLISALLISLAYLLLSGPASDASRLTCRAVPV